MGKWEARKAPWRGPNWKCASDQVLPASAFPFAVSPSCTRTNITKRESHQVERRAVRWAKHLRHEAPQLCPYSVFKTTLRRWYCCFAGSHLSWGRMSYTWRTGILTQLSALHLLWCQLSWGWSCPDPLTDLATVFPLTQSTPHTAGKGSPDKTGIMPHMENS